MQPITVAFLVALAASLILTPAARWLARRVGVVDAPDGKRKFQPVPVPLWGGLSVYSAIVLALLSVPLLAGPVPAEFEQLARTLIAACGFVCLMGSLDDRFDLNPRFKLLLQICSTLPVVLAGYYVERVVVFGYPLELGWFGMPLTVLWLVGCANALNLLDGLDGLASLVGLSTACMMALIASTSGHQHVSILALALAGALSGFLAYNLPPASIYLGDSGSMVIGLAIGILGMQGAMKTSATLSLTAPVVAMSIPILDTVMAVIRRRLNGKPIDRADRGHIHHRLLERGLSNWQALCIVGALCLTTGAAATAATIFRNDALAWITLVSLWVLLVQTRSFGHHEVGLIKLRLSSAVARLSLTLRRLTANSVVHALAGTDGEPSDFEQQWTRFTTEAARADARTVELRYCDAQGIEYCRTWHGSLPSAGASHWSFTFDFDQLPVARCQVRLAGSDAQLDAWGIIRLAQLAERFSRDWSGRLAEMAAAEQPVAIPARREAA